MDCSYLHLHRRKVWWRARGARACVSVRACATVCLCMALKAAEIHDLLQRRAAESVFDADESGPASCDVVYVLFLEPRAEADPRWSAVECIIDKAVRTFQPSPALAHCEILIPPVPFDEGLRTNFSTYIGCKSGWQTDKIDGLNYYLVENGARWRAVPVFGANAATLLRNECDMELGVSYSLARYLTAVAPLRWIAGLVGDKRRSPAHCATLSTRVLRNSGVYAPLHAPAWYGPSTLYRELCEQAARQGERMGASSWAGMSLETTVSVEALLRGVQEPATVRRVGDESCMDAVRALTMRVCHALVSNDATAQRLTQQQLATSLLRWSILRGLSQATSGDREARSQSASE